MIFSLESEGGEKSIHNSFAELLFSKNHHVCWGFAEVSGSALSFVESG